MSRANRLMIVNSKKLANSLEHQPNKCVYQHKEYLVDSINIGFRQAFFKGGFVKKYIALGIFIVGVASSAIFVTSCGKTAGDDAVYGSVSLTITVATP